MKIGLVMEGGAMRGLFSAGVIDVLMENHITFDGAIGVSAGAAFGCNYKSGQVGRAIRYNTKYCRDPRYGSIRSLLKTGDIYSKEFAYGELPGVLDPFDTKAYQENPMEFYVVATNIETGLPVYHKCDTGEGEDLEWFRASASMPLVSRPVEIGEKLLLDGGISDSVPLSYFQSIGYDRNVVILTRPKDYRKKKNKLMPVLHAKLHQYPNMVKALEYRHLMYNKEIAYIREQKEKGTTYIIEPEQALEIRPVEHNPKELLRVYEIGRKTAMQQLDDLQEFLQKC
ncbi:MAG: patatin family protein [Lachnospiraceae bacterium]